jgi:hypothetical protein
MINKLKKHLAYGNWMKTTSVFFAIANILLAPNTKAIDLGIFPQATLTTT